MFLPDTIPSVTRTSNEQNPSKTDCIRQQLPRTHDRRGIHLRRRLDHLAENLVCQHRRGVRLRGFEL